MAKIKGYWKWHEDESTGEWILGDFRWNCSFESNGQTFTDIKTYYNTGVQCIEYIGAGTNKSVRTFGSQGDEIVARWNTKYLVMNFGATWQDIDDELYSFITNHADSWGMSDRLITIYDNEQKVYDKGYQVGNDAGYDEGLEVGYGNGYSAGELKGYNDGKEDGKAEGRAEGKAEGLKEGYNNGYQDGLVSSEAYEKGKQAEYDAFWDAYQENGSASREYEYAFREGFNDENFKPKYDFHIKGNYSGSGMFSRSKITDIVACLNRQGVVWECSQALRLDSTFQQALTKTVPIIDASVLTRLQQTFNGATNLQEIVINNLQASCTFSIAFNNCSALTTVSITGEIGNDINFQWSKKLTRASIENIINHLSDNGSGKTLTLSKAAVDEAFRGISAGDFTTIVPGSSSLDWFNLTHGATVYKQWTITLV